MKPRVAFVSLAALLLASVAAGILLGPAAVSPGEVWRTLLPGAPHGVTHTIVFSVRLPRVIAAVLTGGSLAVAGVLLQALLRNPLAEPYLLGVSSGAALGAVSALTLGAGRLGAATLPLAALAGALLALGLVFRVARVAGRMDTRVLILAGVVASAFFGAAVMLLLTFSRAEALQAAIFWTMGSLGQISWKMVLMLALYTIPGIGVAIALGRHLDALAIGERTAAYLGTDVERVKRGVYLLASLLAAATVSVAGVIGFVGLVVPHTVRLAVGSKHRTLLPLSLLGGAVLLVAADTSARTLASPLEIPVGVVTALIGVPLFLLLLRRRASK